MLQSCSLAIMQFLERNSYLKQYNSVQIISMKNIWLKL